jgi:hypothetical protein
MAEAAKSKPPATINYDFVKGNDFRVFHVDGAFIAGAPSGLTISLYSERQPIPRRVVHNLNADSTPGAEIAEQRVVRDAIIRDVDVALAMNMDTAKNFHKTLGDLITRYEAAMKDLQDKAKK